MKLPLTTPAIILSGLITAGIIGFIGYKLNPGTEFDFTVDGGSDGLTVEQLDLTDEELAELNANSDLGHSVDTAMPDQDLENTTSNSENTMENGLKITDVTVGDGQEAKAGDTVSVHYTGTLRDGTKFDSSVDRGTPFDFELGAGMVIQGWDLGVEGMKIGGKRNLDIPANLAYGERSPSPAIPPSSDLLFEVELLGIK